MGTLHDHVSQKKNRLETTTSLDGSVLYKRAAVPAAQQCTADDKNATRERIKTRKKREKAFKSTVGPITVMRQDIAMCTEISRSARALAMYLCALSSRSRTTRLVVSQEELARHFGCTKNSIRTYRRELEQPLRSLGCQPFLKVNEHFGYASSWELYEQPVPSETWYEAPHIDISRHRFSTIGHPILNEEAKEKARKVREESKKETTNTKASKSALKGISSKKGGSKFCNSQTALSSLILREASASSPHNSPPQLSVSSDEERGDGVIKHAHEDSRSTDVENMMLKDTLGGGIVEESQGIEMVETSSCLAPRLICENASQVVYPPPAALKSSDKNIASTTVQEQVILPQDVSQFVLEQSKKSNRLRSQQSIEPSEEGIQIAKTLYDAVSKKAEIYSYDEKVWAAQIDVMLNNDKVSSKRILRAIEFTSNDKFWKDKVWAPRNIRGHLDTIERAIRISESSRSGYSNHYKPLQSKRADQRNDAQAIEEAQKIVEKKVEARQTRREEIDSFIASINASDLVTTDQAFILIDFSAAKKAKITSKSLPQLASNWKEWIQARVDQIRGPTNPNITPPSSPKIKMQVVASIASPTIVEHKVEPKFTQQKPKLETKMTKITPLEATKDTAALNRAKAFAGQFKHAEVVIIDGKVFVDTTRGQKRIDIGFPSWEIALMRAVEDIVGIDMDLIDTTMLFDEKPTSIVESSFQRLLKKIGRSN